MFDKKYKNYMVKIYILLVFYPDSMKDKVLSILDVKDEIRGRCRPGTLARPSWAVGDVRTKDFPC